MRFKVTKTAIKKQSREIAEMVRKARKKLFELEVLQSVWESEHGLGKVYNSAEDLIEDIHKRSAVYL